ncbi:MAG: deoxyribodipyrimidine photo-lyase [Flavobacteriales bacterium]|nr:deoxyribodipyrimidine photo-lyase [Flavobacteriales bacterium]
MKEKVSIFWFRRDLRLNDNSALYFALQKGKVQCVFIFDDDITKQFSKDDARITFIYDSLKNIHEELVEIGSSLKIYQGNVLKCWKEILQDFNVDSVFCNEDYEPYAIKRDNLVDEFLRSNSVEFSSFKDQVIFSPNEILKQDQTPYLVYTPYSKKWKEAFNNLNGLEVKSINLNNLHKSDFDFPKLELLGFTHSKIKVKPYSIENKLLDNYAKKRDFPAENGTSNLGIYLRFGIVSIREIVNEIKDKSDVFLNELIWREFFIQILYHYPENENFSFRRKYENIQWRNNEEEFELWKQGKTGFPIVDAGMRELNETGMMHNRVRMIVANFLCKYLLIDWRWGEAYFAQKLLDYELASNNGNWQWSAGCGCDSAPYFRVFNPTLQAKKFDSEFKYIKKWIPEINDFSYPKPMISEKFARERALKVYKEGLE